MLTTKFTGNLGNQLFELWSLVGLADKQRHEVSFPDWPHYNVFKGPFPQQSFIPHSVVKEREYTHHMPPELAIAYDGFLDFELDGYWQSEKYWAHCEDRLRKLFDFKYEFLHAASEKIPGLFSRRTICISIRRGDFVGNDTYYQLPIKYYIGALLTHFPDYQNCNILVLSDDVPYTRVHFECLQNVWFADELTPIEQLCLASYCDDFIISNSTFSWWCAYLAHTKQENGKWGSRGKVIRPKYNFGDEYRATHPEHDYWPDRENWIVFDYEEYKYDLKDTTFMIPVFYDHKDRRQNLDLTVCMLQRDFDTNIIVMEQGTDKFVYMKQWCKYVKFMHRHFHRTKMLNDMAKIADTPLLFNWDADVFVPPMQIIATVLHLRAGVSFVYPYDGRFARVVREVWFKELQSKLDVGIFGTAIHFGRGGKPGKPMATTSVGGAVGMRKADFIESGMENQNMVSYAPEDCERWDRWHILGYDVARIKGKIFHMDHWIGVNSSSRNQHFDSNHKELDKIRAMDQQTLREYVNTWAWCTTAIENPA